MHRVAVAAHDAGGRRDVVGDDPVAALARQLGAGVGDACRRSRRRSRRRARGRPSLRWATVGEDVGILDEHGARAARRRPSSSSAGAALVDAPVGDGGGERRRRRPAAPPRRRPASRARSRHGRARRPAGSASATGPETSVTSRAGRRGGARRWRGPACRTSGWRCSAPDRSARRVGPAVTSTCRPASGPRRPGVAGEQRLDRGDDRRRLGHAAGAEFAAGHRALVGPDEGDAVGAAAARGCAASPDAATCARSSPAPSAPACRWRAAAVEARSSARPLRHLGHQVGRRRRHDHEIGRRATARYGPSRPRRSARTGRCRPCRRTAPRRDSGVTNCCAAAVRIGAHGGAALAQPAHQFQRLVGGDAAADDQEDAAAGQGGHGFNRPQRAEYLACLRMP